MKDIKCLVRSDQISKLESATLGNVVFEKIVATRKIFIAR